MHEFNQDNVSATAEPLLCSGYGKYHSPNNKRNPQPLAVVTLEEIRAMLVNPQAGLEKDCAQWAIFSTLLSRVHDEQYARGEYYALWVDLDKPNGLTLANMVVVAKCLIPGDVWAYTSRSATENYQKARLIFPLSRGVSGVEWVRLQKALNRRLALVGITPDYTTERAGQPCYLPNRGEYYTYQCIECIGPLDPAAMAEDLRAIEAEALAKHESSKAAHEAARQKAAQRVVSGELSPIDAYNAEYGIPMLLDSFGYLKRGSRWLSPNSQSRTPGVSVTKDGKKWLSAHGSDADIGRPTENGTMGDAFDLYVHYEHAGDFNTAVHAAGKMFGLSGPGVDAAWAFGGGAFSSSINRDDFFAYMPDHKYIFAPTGAMCPASSVDGRIPPVDGMKASAWMDAHRSVEQAIWAPGEPQLVEGRLLDDGGWIVRGGLRAFNLYRPPAASTGDKNDVQPWLDHIAKLYPEELEHIVYWLAHRVQFPGDKVNHALVFGGTQGIGKDTILEPMKLAIGPWNMQEVSPIALLGRFNGFVKSVILRISEARDLGELDRFKFYDHMKVYTAAPPDVLRCDEKNMREYSVMNVCGVIITTNHKSDGIYLPPDDRRHFVAWSNIEPAEFPPGYWRTIYGWYAKGGSANVAAYLRGLDLSSFDPKAPPPRTQAWWHIVNANRSQDESDLEDVLDACGRPAVVTVAELARVASQMNNGAHLWLTGMARGGYRVIPHKMEKVGYVSVNNAAAKDGKFKVGGKRESVYARRELSERDQQSAVAALQGDVGGPCRPSIGSAISLRQPINPSFSAMNKTPSK